MSSGRASLDDARESFTRFREAVPGRFATLQRNFKESAASKPDDQQQQHAGNRFSVQSAAPGRHAREASASTTASRPRSSDSPPATPLARAPPLSDPAYDERLARLAARILFRAGTDPVSGGPLLILCAAAFPDANEVNYDRLLPYVLSNLPSDDELGGMEDGGTTGGYSVVFFAGGDIRKEGSKSKRQQPTWQWTLKAYHLLGRAVRKKIRRLWVVHERAWVRVIFEVMASVVSAKFRRKVVHLNTLSDLFMHLDITKLSIPPAVYLHDRRLAPTIDVPGFPRPPVFGQPPFNAPHNPPRVGDNMPVPAVLLETTQCVRTRGVHLEGIFRVPAPENLLGIVQEAYDRRQLINWDEWSPHVAASTIKRYYRSLPTPIIPPTLYHILLKLRPTKPSAADKLMTAAGSPPAEPTPEDLRREEEERFEAVQELLTAEEGGLPPFSRVLLLRHLLPLLSFVASHSSENKMSPDNLAICIAPSLYDSKDVQQDMAVSPGIIRFVEIAIQHLEDLAPKPPLRRVPAGKAHADNKRISWASTTTAVSAFHAAPGSRPGSGHRPNTPPDLPQRKKVPALTMPHWEKTLDDKHALVRKPVPTSSSNSSANHSPATQSPVVPKLEVVIPQPANPHPPIQQPTVPQPAMTVESAIPKRIATEPSAGGYVAYSPTAYTNSPTTVGTGHTAATAEFPVAAVNSVIPPRTVTHPELSARSPLPGGGSNGLSGGAQNNAAQQAMQALLPQRKSSLPAGGVVPVSPTAIAGASATVGPVPSSSPSSKQVPTPASAEVSPTTTNATAPTTTATTASAKASPTATTPTTATTTATTTTSPSTSSPAATATTSSTPTSASSAPTPTPSSVSSTSHTPTLPVRPQNPTPNRALGHSSTTILQAPAQPQPALQSILHPQPKSLRRVSSATFGTAASTTAVTTSTPSITTASSPTITSLAALPSTAALSAPPSLVATRRNSFLALASASSSSLSSSSSLMPDLTEKPVLRRVRSSMTGLELGGGTRVGGVGGLGGVGGGFGRAGVGGGGAGGGRAVGELKALFEQRAKTAEELGRAGRERGASYSGKK